MRRPEEPPTLVSTLFVTMCENGCPFGRSGGSECGSYSKGIYTYFNLFREYMAIGTTIEVNNFQREHLQNTQKWVFDNSVPDISALKN